MSEKIIICIARQFGSGGRSIGKKLAKALEIDFYDQELIDEAAKESGLDKEMVKEMEETPTSSLLYSINNSSFFGVGNFSPIVELPVTDRLFMTQSNIIREAAEKGSCVIVGRCADYVLREDPDLMTIFIHRERDERINQVSKLYDLNDKKAADMVKKMDKKRSNYYNYYSDQKWGMAENYDLCIDSGSIGEDHAVALIQTYIEKWTLRRKVRG